jgi:hypothetical protein
MFALKGFWRMTNLLSFQEESSCASFSHHSCEDSSTIHVHRCLTLGKADEYNHITRAFQPMTIVILLKDIIVALR